MRSIRRKTIKNFIELCYKLDMTQKEVEKLVSEKGEYMVGDFTLRVERKVIIEGWKLPTVSLWKGGCCYYKGAVNPHLFET